MNAPKIVSRLRMTEIEPLGVVAPLGMMWRLCHEVTYIDGTKAEFAIITSRTNVELQLFETQWASSENQENAV